jgi:N-acetylglucosaminyldiphosphoundecaprenol N-acetyl-beta-D-mannosaminyltransferase
MALFASDNEDGSPPGRGEELGRSMQRRVVVGGIPVDALDSPQWCQLMLTHWELRKGAQAPPKVVTTANGQVLSLFGSNRTFAQAVLDADGVAADGMSIVNGSRKFAADALPSRVATTDWFHDAARLASDVGMRFFFIGATEDANHKAIAEVRSLYPALKIAGHRCGYFEDSEIPDIAQAVDQAATDILWLGIGNPRQLLVAHEFKRHLRNVTWVRTCGGLFDHLSGAHRRAPRAIQNMGFEWAWRVAMEPRRLLWRYLTTNVHAMYMMRKHSEKHKNV